MTWGQTGCQGGPQAWAEGVGYLRTHLPVLLGGVKVVQEAAEHLLLRPLPAPHPGVSAAAVHSPEVIHSHHAIPAAVQLGERGCDDCLPDLGHGGLWGGW